MLLFILKIHKLIYFVKVRNSFSIKSILYVYSKSILFQNTLCVLKPFSLFEPLLVCVVCECFFWICVKIKILFELIGSRTFIRRGSVFVTKNLQFLQICFKILFLLFLFFFFFFLYKRKRYIKRK